MLSADSSQIGQEVEWQVVCSALGPPGASITSYIRYGQGIDKHTELINFAVDIGLINKGGAWYTYGKEKFQGMEKLRQYFVDNPKEYATLEDSVKQTMGIKCK
jgi:recombination protein RecA